MRGLQPGERAGIINAAMRDLELAYAFSRAHHKLSDWAQTKYGDGSGVTISGVYREHFPGPVKTRLRFLAHNVGTYLERSLERWKYAGRRRATWLREKEGVKARDGCGFYG